MVWLMSHLFFKGVSDDIYLTAAHACWPPPPPLARPSLAQSSSAQLGSVQLHVRSLFLLDQRDVFSAIHSSTGAMIQCHSWVPDSVPFIQSQVQSIQCHHSVVIGGSNWMPWDSYLRVLWRVDSTVSRKINKKSFIESMLIINDLQDGPERNIAQYGLSGKKSLFGFGKYALLFLSKRLTQRTNHTQTHYEHT